MWCVEWYVPHPDGGRPKRCTRSLGIVGRDRRRDAEDAAAELNRRAAEAAASAPPPPRVTVAEYADVYLNSVRRSVRETSLVTYRRHLTPFAAAHADMALADVTPAVIDAWVRGLDLAPNTVNVALASVSGMFAHAVRHDLLAANPARRVRGARVPTKDFPPFVTLEDYWRIVDPACRRAWVRAAVRLGMFAGLRRGEAAALRWEDVDMAAGMIRVVSTGDHETKSGRRRLVPILAPVAEALEAVPRRGPLVLGVTPRAVAAAWDAMRARVPGWPPISFHGLRHSYATWLASSGLPLRTLAEVLGHADIRMTMAYAHVQPLEAAAQIRAIFEASGGR